MFEDRRDAGRQLAQALDKYKDQDVIVLAIPRGGIEIGYEVAKYLGAELTILVSRKLPYPSEPESGFGAIAEDGSLFIFEEAARWQPKEEVDQIIEEQLQEIQRRVKVFRRGKSLPNITGRTVILTDDGLAMGSTMRAAIDLCKHREAGQIIVAVPVAGRQVAQQIGRLAGDIVVLDMPSNFRAVAQAYRNWYDVQDEDVLEIMDRWMEEKSDK